MPICRKFRGREDLKEVYFNILPTDDNAFGYGLDDLPSFLDG